MNNIIELVKQCPEAIISVKASELMDLGRFCVSEAEKSLKQHIADASTETYLTPKKTANMLCVDSSTLWRWNKRNYLQPISVGGRRLYRKSDIDKILSE